MTLAIHEQGGLTDAEIQLRIEEAQNQTAATLDTKLKEQAEAIDRRLGTTDQAMRELTTQAGGLKADVAVLMASDGQQTKLLQDLVSKSESWHSEAVDLHATLVQKVSKIETEQQALASQMRLLKWAAATSAAVAKAAAFLVASEGARNLIIMLVAALILHILSPSLFELVKGLLELLK